MTKRAGAFHIAYLAAIAIKGLDGAVETVAGLTIAVTGPEPVYALVLRFTAPELYDHPENHAARLLQHGAASLAQTSTHFIVTYLLIHGILKCAVAVVLLRGGSRWIFPLASAILAGFIVFMGYHLIRHASGWILGFALFDLLTLALVLNEWRSRPANKSG